MEKYDLRGEMAPRDMVARAIFQEQQKGFYVYLDIRHKGERFIKRRFPNIYRELKKRGFDLANEPIPVTPAAHYSCGGINVDLYGRTSINNLFAFGEVACNGVHGANRLASNSLLEAVVFPLRLNVIASLDLIGARRSRWISEYRSGLLPPLSGVAMTCAHQERKLLYEKLEKSLKRLMWEKVGIVRTRKGMREAFAQIKIWEGEWKDIKEVSQKIAELKNMLAVARLVTTAALKRKKSLGAHFIRLRPDVRRGFGGFSRLSGIPLQR